MTVGERIAALAAQAQRWQGPDHAPRAESVEAMLEASPRFTEEGLAFALNHRMHQFSDERLISGWLGSEPVAAPKTIGVTSPALDPAGGLTEAVAALVLDHAVVLEAPTPPVAAFLDELGGAFDGEVHTAGRDALLDAADLWIVRYSDDEAEAVQRDLDTIPAARADALVIGPRAIVLDGREDQEALSGIAEDLLLHEGLAPGTPRIVWAPAGTPPDALLNALAGFRELFPAHPDTDGTLALPTAFLASTDQPHATGPGFLLSRGAPEAQTPAHIRWAEYGDLSEVEAWAEAQPGIALVAHQSLHDRHAFAVASVRPGDVHRTGLDRRLPLFLRGL